MKNAFAFLRQMAAQGHFSLCPEETEEEAIQRFWAEAEARGPLPIPDFQFTEEENRRMDEILAEERQAKDRASQIIERKPPRALPKPMNVLTVAFLGALTATSFSAYAQRFDKRHVMGEEYARQKIQAVAKGAKATTYSGPLLPTKAVAIAALEPMLFNIYGKRNITRQRPYEAYFIDGSWYISGTLPKGSRGGVFEIIVDASTGCVSYLSQGR